MSLKDEGSALLIDSFNSKHHRLIHESELIAAKVSPKIPKL